MRRSLRVAVEQWAGAKLHGIDDERGGVVGELRSIDRRQDQRWNREAGVTDRYEFGFGDEGAFA